MKKIAYIFTIGAAALAMTACNQNTDPKYHDVPEGEMIKLNTPPLATQYFKLTPEGTIQMTWSQPNWGFAAAASYEVQIAFDKAEFDKADKGDETAVYYVLPTLHSSCNSNISMQELAEGISDLRGITDIYDWTPCPPVSLLVRVRGFIEGVESSSVLSNTITLTTVDSFAAVRQPGRIYLVGKPSGWTEPSAANAAFYSDWSLVEKVIDEKIYYGTFNVDAGIPASDDSGAIFRFYTGLEGWEVNSVGPTGGPDADKLVDVNDVITAAGVTYELTATKDKFNFAKWTGGNMSIVVDMSKSPNTATFSAADAE